VIGALRRHDIQFRLQPRFDRLIGLKPVARAFPREEPVDGLEGFAVE